MNTEKMWTVQACSSAQSRDAERCHALIEKAGFTAAIRQLQGHEKSRYRVQLGPYVSQAEAVKTRNALQAKGYRSAYWFSHREPLQSVVAEPESRTPAAVNEPAAASESVALDIPA